MLANLLQELTLAQKENRRFIILEEWKLTEDPVHRLDRMIKELFWDNLTRTMDESGIKLAALDPKAADSSPRIYIPRGAPEQFAYYEKIAHTRPDLGLDVQWLPEGEITAEFIKSLNDKPGILALAMESVSREDMPGEKILKGLPFVVPGGRFNELYNWDACFCTLGMLDSHPHIVKSMIRHFIFEIKHYGKVLNANRSYYLGRSQPPFFTALATRTYQATRYEPDAKELFRLAILAAIKEYHNLWMAEPRFDKISGLSRYRPIGLGFPPECEPQHFAHVLRPYALKYNMSVDDSKTAYDDGKIKEPELDEFCLHDRAARESGHDTSKRTENAAANNATIDLNCLLYRYETDIAHALRTEFDDALEVPAAFCAPGQVSGRLESSSIWERRARKRKLLINKLMWNEDEGLYFDYDTATGKQCDYETATSLWALWCGVASPAQAALLVERGLPRFECAGGLSSGTQRSRGAIGVDNPQKQWDYPHGWAPHQVLAWDGLRRYGYDAEAERLIYRWLHMITRVSSEYNGSIVEKYDVTQLHHPHKVGAEYGNQGLAFKGISEGG
jgi:alpha,alpha-trehalase